jgi:hypothetical protein
MAHARVKTVMMQQTSRKEDGLKSRLQEEVLKQLSSNVLCKQLQGRFKAM